MSYSIYDSFLTLDACKYYCKQVAARLNLSIYEYFYDNLVEKQFEDTDITHYREFMSYESWQVKFRLNKPKTIMKMGLDAYVAQKRELTFHLTIRGYSFLYVVKFYEPVVHEVPVVTTDLYVQDASGQMCMVLN